MAKDKEPKDLLHNVASLENEYKKTMDLKAYSDAQYKVIVASKAKIVELEDKVRHLENLLKLANPAPVQSVIISPEQGICEQQIDILQQSALQRELTLEETKKFEIFVKTLALIKGKDANIPAEGKTILPKDISDAQLIALATSEDKH